MRSLGGFCGGRIFACEIAARKHPTQSVRSQGSIERGFSRPYSANIKPIFHILIVAPLRILSQCECVWVKRVAAAASKTLSRLPCYLTGGEFCRCTDRKINNNHLGKEKLSWRETVQFRSHWKQKLQSHFAAGSWYKQLRRLGEKLLIARLEPSVFNGCQLEPRRRALVCRRDTRGRKGRGNKRRRRYCQSDVSDAPNQLFLFVSSVDHYPRYCFETFSELQENLPRK